MDLALLSLVEHKLLVRMGYGPWALYTVRSRILGSPPPTPVAHPLCPPFPFQIPPESVYQATQIAYADFPCESDVSGGMAEAPSAAPPGDGDAAMAAAPCVPAATSPCSFATAALRRQMSPRPRPPRGSVPLRSTRFCGKRGHGGADESSQKRARLARPLSSQASGGDPMSP